MTSVRTQSSLHSPKQRISALVTFVLRLPKKSASVLAYIPDKKEAKQQDYRLKREELAKWRGKESSLWRSLKGCESTEKCLELHDSVDELKELSLNDLTSLPDSLNIRLKWRLYTLEELLTQLSSLRQLILIGLIGQVGGCCRESLFEIIRVHYREDIWQQNCQRICLCRNDRTYRLNHIGYIGRLSVRKLNARQSDGGQSKGRGRADHKKKLETNLDVTNAPLSHCFDLPPKSYRSLLLIFQSSSCECTVWLERWVFIGKTLFLSQHA